MGKPYGEEKPMAQVEDNACAQKPCQNPLGCVALPIAGYKDDEPAQTYEKRYEAEQCSKHCCPEFLYVLI